MKQNIPFQKIADELNVQANDILLLASDVSKLAYSSIKNKEKFDSNLFIDSFQVKLDSGTLLFPAFIHSFRSGDLFDKNALSPEMGTLSKTAFQRQDFHRNTDPLHSFLVWGEKAKEIREIKPDSTFGRGSVFEYLFDHKAKMLLIDVDLQHSFTFAHFVEEIMKVGYRSYSKVNYKLKDDTEKVRKESILIYSKKKGIFNTLNYLEKSFLQEGVMQEYKINQSRFLMIDLERAFDIIKQEIELNKGRNLYYFDRNAYFRAVAKSILGK